MANLLITSSLTIPEHELSVSFTHASGKGGQNVNKVETKVEVRWSIATSSVLSEADRVWLQARLAGRLTSAGQLVVTSQKTRHQSRNRVDAEAKLAHLVAEALKRPTIRRKKRIPRSLKERRLQNKRQQADKKRQRSGDWKDDS